MPRQIIERPRKVIVLALVAAAVLGGPAAAQNSAVIDGGAVSGATIVNSAAGNNNQQANVGVLANGATAQSNAGLAQHLEESGAVSGPDSVVIAAGAFAGSSGWLAVNGTSGNDNQTANLAAFAFGTKADGLADTSLSQTRASTQPTGSAGPAAAEPDRTVAIGEGALEGSSGLIQVNLVAGDRNASANSFAMSVSGPAGQ